MPLTETGYERPIQADVKAEIDADQRARISSQLDLSPSTVLGNCNEIDADQLAQAYEVLEEAYNSHDPDNATGDRVEALSLLTGTIRRKPQKGSATVTCTLAGGAVYEAGTLVVHVPDDPTNRWISRDDVDADDDDEYDVVFLSEGTGSAYTAVVGAAVIAEPLSGFSEAAFAEDATPGLDLETIEELRARRERELALGGSGSVDALRAELLQLDGVRDALVEENITDDVLGGLPAHSIRAVVWDSDPGQVDDDVIAQLLLDNGPAGIRTAGDITGVAVRKDGTVTTRNFARAEVVELYVDVDIESAVGVRIDDIKDAIVSAVQVLIGADVKYQKLAASVFIPGVDDFASFTLGTAPSPVGTSNITISNTQVPQIDRSNINVTGDVS